MGNRHGKIDPHALSSLRIRMLGESSTAPRLWGDDWYGKPMRRRMERLKRENIKDLHHGYVGCVIAAAQVMDALEPGDRIHLRSALLRMQMITAEFVRRIQPDLEIECE